MLARLVLLFALLSSLAHGQCLSARNSTSSTACAEEDNVNIPITGLSSSFLIEATHPAYAVGTDSCQADFTNCSIPPSAAYPFVAATRTLFDDGETVVVARRDTSWWRPTGMTATGSAGSLDNAHYVVVYKRLKAGDYRQILVLYADSNLRIIPLPQAPADRDVCFGSSVMVGPAQLAARPVADIASMSYTSGTQTLTVQYRGGGAADLVLDHADRTTTRVRVNVRYAATASLATFRSMWVSDGNADVDHVQWRDAASVLHDDAISAYPGGGSADWFFHRVTRSQHNTSAPDIRIRSETAVACRQGGLVFVPMTPCRLVDTRPAYAGSRTGAFAPPMLSANVTRTIPVPQSDTCTIPGVAQAYAFNVTLDTVENGTGPVDLVTVWPTGEPRPDFATARTSTGGYIANTAIVKAGLHGAVDVSSSQAVHFILDISGYFTEPPVDGGLVYYPVAPCRAVDTRGALYTAMQPPYGQSRMQKFENRTLRLPASPGCHLPAAPAYSLQMTLAPGVETNGAPVAFVTAYPSGTSLPNVSNMNSTSGYAVANSAIVPASANGEIDVYAYDATNLILDVNGYFATDNGSGLYFRPVRQCRVLNTQDLTQLGPFGPPQLTPAADRSVPVPSSRCSGLPTSGVGAWVLNAAVIPGGAPMPYLSLWPSRTAWPNISQLNAFQGQTVANSCIVPATFDGGVDLRVANSTHATLDVAGYFSR